MATHKKNKRNVRRKRAARARRPPCLDHRGPLPPRRASDDYTIKEWPPPRRDYTIKEWCAKRRVSRGLFYEMLKLGIAPKTMKLRKRRTISEEADAEWQAQREAATAAEAP